MKVAVLGAGPGGLAAAADMVTRGEHDVMIADLPEFADRVAAVADRGGVEVTSGWRGPEFVPADVAESIDRAVSGRELIIVAVRAPGHQRFAVEVLAAADSKASVLFIGEGGGALVMQQELRDHRRPDGLLVGETNALPFIARSAGPATITVTRKRGGVVLAAIPATEGEALYKRVRDVWPYIETCDSVWTTALLNFDAIDTVPAAITNAAALETRPRGYLLWGEGGSPSVIRLIEAVDRELRALRHALGSRDNRRFQDFLVGQGLAPEASTLYEAIREGVVSSSVRRSGDEAALADLTDLDVQWTLVLASSIGRAVNVTTPVIDGVIDLTSTMLGRNLREEGRTLASIGLGGVDAEGLREYVA